MLGEDRSLICVEGEPFSADAAIRNDINIAFRRLQQLLRFRSWPLSDSADGKLVVRGIVGVVSLAAGRTLEIIPKTEPTDDWVASILHLLVGPDRIDAAGERTGGLTPERKALLPLLAAIYAARLEKALRRDGPILLLQRQRHSRTVLRGKLNASTWLRHALHRPHIFPTESNDLTADNDFGTAMAAVAGQLASFAGSSGVRARLLAAQKGLRPGLPLGVSAPPGIELQRLPAQWAVYEPAWMVASAILLRRSLLAPSGRREAVSVVIEAWPLLERLLERALRAAARSYKSEAGDPTVSIPSGPKSKTLLLPAPGSVEGSRSVEPDAWLQVDGQTRATFDAKYKKREQGNWPNREDIYQVLCTASAFNSPLAVLVYPEQFHAVWWEVKGMNGSPARMAAIGLGLYSYKSGEGDIERGRAILDLLTKSGAAPAPLPSVGVLAA
jgi:hypothetical protein